MINLDPVRVGTLAFAISDDVKYQLLEPVAQFSPDQIGRTSSGLEYAARYCFR